jgi:hypothetical protein
MKRESAGMGWTYSGGTLRVPFKDRLIPGWVVITVLAIISLVVLGAIESQINRPALCDSMGYEAYQFVHPMLNAPDGASYGPPSGTLLGDGTCEVTGYVDVQNSLGARSHTPFVFHLTRDGNGWRVVSSDFDQP